MQMKQTFIFVLLVTTALALKASSQHQMSQSPFFSISLHDQRAVSNQTYQQKCKIQLDRHNQYRRKHHVPDLQLSSDLNKIAQAYADKLGPTNKIKHSGTKYKGQWMGENLYWSSPPSPAGKATDNWYNQVKMYTYGRTPQAGTGHFTQVVWKGTQYVGFGYSKGVVVANYYPGGNIGGRYKENVLKP